MQASLETITHVEVRYRIRQVNGRPLGRGCEIRCRWAGERGKDSGYRVLSPGWSRKRRCIFLGHSFISFIKRDSKWASLKALFHIGLRLRVVRVQAPTYLYFLAFLRESEHGELVFWHWRLAPLCHADHFAGGQCEAEIGYLHQVINPLL